ncbi:hypothetical protein CBR_g81573 [Chara braunii]|uniref:Reverse transcriptase RNase H-like domain-containing protein n=1 Tax=Chara braunii TaxID=69332 RepID=A0A388KAR2_CHABU|nr:hypothetical protein CBR_g81573 [Chara braunii]|eukprot:GBG67148.1 hypothetical protein CBR_g81573 [Chara braunii]
MPRAALVLGNPLVYAELGKMTTEDETDNHGIEGGPSLGGSAVHNEEGQKDRESANPDGTKGNQKEISSGESSGKAGGSRQGTQETKEGRNKDRTSPRNSERVVSKKVRVTDARRKLAEIKKMTAQYKASPRLLKGLRQLMTRRRVEIDENPKSPEGEGEEEVPQEVANLQRSRGDLEDLEKAFADIRLSLLDREGGEFKKEALAILHCLKTFQAYLFGRRFILRIDPTNFAGTLKNYRPIDPTVGGWVGFIWQFDYKIERIAGIRNKADGLSRVCVTPEGLEDAEPIDVFLENEGGTIAVDNEMMGEECASGELLIRTLEKATPVVVAELREEPVTTREGKEEKDSWGAIVGPKEELIAMAVEGGREAVMSIVKSWEKKELRWMVNQMQERKDEDQEGKEFFYAQIYEGIFRKIGLLLVGNKQSMKVSIKAREEAERLDDDKRMTTKELIEVRCQQVLKNEEVMEDIANRVLYSRMRDKARWDQVKNVRKEPLQVGETVLPRNSALESTWSGQLGRRFKGPYRVAKRVGLNTFELEDLDETGLK